jgi:ABC-type sugar transport system substrate-binding protein
MEQAMRITPTMRAAVLAVVLGLIVAACGDDTTDEPVATPDAEDPADDPGDDADPVTEDEDWVIGVSLPSSTTTLYIEMAAGMEDLGEELGVEVVVNYAQEDLIEQLNTVDTLLGRGVDGILISPLDFEGSQPAYETARSQDVPIMSIARSTDPSLHDAFIGANWEEYGVQIAEWTCDKVGGEGQVAMLMGPAGASFVMDMEEGYKGYMASECPGIEIVFETNVVPMTAEQALPPAEDALSAFPDLVAIYAQQDDMAKGVLTVLEEQGRLGDVVVTGFDGSPEALGLVRDGTLDMTIALQPYKWGQLGLETMLRYLRGEDVGDFIEIETTLVDGDNIDQYTDEELR